jgi:pyridoxal phosphate enzyme (YggS family)
MTLQPSLIEKIQRNLDAVNERILKAAQHAGRRTEDVLIVAVSKKQPIEVVQAAREAGLCNFGENYPEQAIEKIQYFQTDLEIRWHMIGHLQSRKTKLVADHFDFFQSLDSLQLAVRLSGLLSLHDKRLPVLLQFNVGGEDNKHGWDASNEDEWERLFPEVEEILNLPNLQVNGLMTMPPLETDAEQSRVYFSRLFRLREVFRQAFPQNAWAELSMGTSIDYEAAILEGATIIRIGQAILGERV